ncbi:MAG TPA: dihydrofolate reductase family protein [Methanoregulaceae archaeon]|nr:dihydrofolate reductase family protein [Methanoregulaceae archaeon]
MGIITSFTIVSVDGYFAGPNGEIDWFKNSDEEDRLFAAESSQGSSTLVFGRTTYEMMASYWPTPDATRNDPVTAGVLNNAQKIVFSKTMKPVKDGAVWKNVRVVHEINPADIAILKEKGDIGILGSGSIVRQFSNLGLIDEYGLLVVPVVLGAGKYLFMDVKKIDLELTGSRIFKNGKVFLKYRPAWQDVSRYRQPDADAG